MTNERFHDAILLQKTGRQVAEPSKHVTAVIPIGFHPVTIAKDALLPVKKMNLVTGGAGFIGSHLVALLRTRGQAVRVLDLKAPLEPCAGVEYRQGSITDREAVAAAVAGCTRVYHLAAMSGLWAADKKAFIDVNERGTQNVLAAAQSAGVQRVVHTSTESILIAMGRGRAPQVVNEKTRWGAAEMAGAYCLGKWCAEQAALAAAAAGQDVVVVNPTVPVGPGDHWLTPPTRMMLGFLNGRLPGWIDSTLNLADARDIALGHWLAAERGTAGRRYILGAHDVRLGDLVALLGRLSGRRMPRFEVPYPLAWMTAVCQEWLADHITHRPPAAPLAGVRLAGIPVRFDNRETRAALGWQPRPLVASLGDALADYGQRGLLESAA